VAQSFELHGDILVRLEKFEEAKEKFERAKFLYTSSDLRMLSKNCTKKVDTLTSYLPAKTA